MEEKVYLKTMVDLKLKKKVERMAKEDRRSVTKTVEMILEIYFAKREKS